MKKYLIFILLFFLLVGAASAVDYSKADTKVTLDGVDFNIPKGFGELENMSVNEKDANGTVKLASFFVNENNDFVMVSVVTSSEDIAGNLTNYVPEDVECENATVKEHEGIKWQDDGEEFFLYIQGNDVVLVEAPDESFIEDIVQ